MARPDRKEIEDTKRLMGALLRMPPKPHEEVKLGKRRRKRHLGKVETKPTKAKKVKE
jgi:hypothetical protein